MEAELAARGGEGAVATTTPDDDHSDEPLCDADGREEIKKPEVPRVKRC